MIWKAIGFSAGLHATVLGGLCGTGWLLAAGPEAPASFGACHWAPEARPGSPVILEASGAEVFEPPSMESLSEHGIEETEPLPAMKEFPFPMEEPLASGRIPQAVDAMDGWRPPRPSQTRHGGRVENEAGPPSGSVDHEAGPGGVKDPWPCPPPPYPPEAASRGIEGVLEVEVQVLPDGDVGRVRLLSSSGSPILDRCALAWIPTRWGPFQPMRNEAGLSISYTFSRPVRFSLAGR